MADGPTVFAAVKKLRSAERVFLKATAAKIPEVLCETGKAEDRSSISEAAPMFDLLSPVELLQMIAELAKVLLLDDAPLPEESFLNHAAFSAVNQAFHSQVIIECDLDPEWVSKSDDEGDHPLQEETTGDGDEDGDSGGMKENPVYEAYIEAMVIQIGVFAPPPAAVPIQPQPEVAQALPEDDAGGRQSGYAYFTSLMERTAEICREVHLMGMQERRVIRH